MEAVPGIVIAADRGHLSVLQWAKNRGCPWDSLPFLLLPAKGMLMCCSGPGAKADPGWESDSCLAQIIYLY